MATAQPPFSSPSIRSAGTTTSSKNTSANSRSPLIISSGATVMPGRVHVDEERGDAAVPRVGRSRSREEHAAVGVLRQAGPDLLAVDDPSSTRVRGVALGRGAAAQRRQVAPRARLGEALAPDLGAREQAGDDLGGQLGRREVDEGGREHLDQRVEPGIREVAPRDAPRRAPSAASGSRLVRRRAPAIRIASSPPRTGSTSRAASERCGRRAFRAGRTGARAPRGARRASAVELRAVVGEVGARESPMPVFGESHSHRICWEPGRPARRLARPLPVMRSER